LVFKVLSEKFGNHDLSGLKLRSYENLLIPGPTIAYRQILLNVSLSSDMGTFFRIKPSTMTDFEFGTFCFCVERRYRSGTIKTILELLEHAVLKQPLEVPIDKYKKHINILAEGIQKQNWKGRSISFGNKKNETDITIVSLLGSGKTRAIPKKWDLEDIACHMLSTGDLPTPGQARKMANRSSVSMSAITKTLERE
jgi:hypothetical protein